MSNGKKYEQKTRTTFILVLVVIISTLFLRLIWGFTLSLVMAAVMAGVAQPIYSRLASLFSNRKAIASATTVFLCVCLIIVPLLLLMGIVSKEAIGISETAGGWLKENVQKQKLEENPTLRKLLPYQDQIVEKVGQLASNTASFVAQAIIGGAAGMIKFFPILFIMLYAMFYFLKDGRAIIDCIFAYTPLLDSEKRHIVATFNSVAGATLKGTLVIGVVQGGLGAVAFAVAGINSVFFWGVIMAVLSVIPGIGSALVWIPAVIYLAVTGQVVAAVGLGLWCVIIVTTADNVLRPILVGKDTKMPDLMVLITTFGGLALFGASGIVVGPIVGALFITVWNLWPMAMTERTDMDSE